jgi:hypothetical protein
MRRVLCAVVAAVLWAAPASFAADGQLVGVDGGSTLVTFNANGSGPRTLWSGQAVATPRWSPDGNRIAFTAAGRVEVLDVPSGRVTEVGDGVGPAWSPDGTRIAFVRGAQIVTRLADGSGEQVLPVDGSGVRAIAWSVDDYLALWVADSLDLASVDGEDRGPVADGVSGAPAWWPDGSRLVYPRDSSLFELTEDGEVQFTYPLSGERDPAAAMSPTGTRVAFLRTGAGAPELGFAGPEPGSASFGGQPGAANLSDLSWQPCVAGVTASCTSFTPLPPALTPACPPVLSLVTVVGGARNLFAQCTGSTALTIVTPPAHGTATVIGLNSLRYIPALGFVGTDTFTFAAGRGRVRSTVSRVDVTVQPRPPKPAAPKLTVIGRPRLDRRGRVVVRAICDRACLVKLRVRVRLKHGHNLDGRAVRASAPANGTVVLRMRRAATKRRILGARVLGRITGADGRTRLFSLTLR